MNYRSSISFHGKRLRWCPQTWHRCRNQPTRREDLAQDVLMYPEPSLTGAQGNLCCSPSCLWPPQDLPFSLCSPPLPATGAWGGCAELHALPQLSPKISKGLFIFCCWLQWEMKWSPVHEGMDKRQHLSCSFSLNGRDSCSRWHELAYPTYMHLLASRQLRGTNQTSLFWFGGKEEPQATISVYLSGSGIIH